MTTPERRALRLCAHRRDVNAIAPGDADTPVMNRGLNDGALVLPSLYGGSGEETHQIMLFLSVQMTSAVLASTS